MTKNASVSYTWAFQRTNQPSDVSMSYLLFTLPLITGPPWNPFLNMMIQQVQIVCNCILPLRVVLNKKYSQFTSTMILTTNQLADIIVRSVKFNSFSIKSHAKECSYLFETTNSNEKNHRKYLIDLIMVSRLCSGHWPGFSHLVLQTIRKPDLMVQPTYELLKPRNKKQENFPKVL